MLDKDLKCKDQQKWPEYFVFCLIFNSIMILYYM